MPLPTPTPTPAPISEPKKLLVNKSNGTVFFNRKAETTTLPALMMSGSGDPHMMIRVANGVIVARWDDNKQGSEGEELLFFHVKTSAYNISIFYTKGGWGEGPKIISSSRVIYNGVSTSYSGSGLSNINVGPINVNVSPYTLVLSMDSISNVLEYGGAAFIAIEAAAKAQGYVDGGWGSQVDGYANLANGTCTGCVSATTLQPNHFIVGQGVTIGQDNSVTSQGILSTNEKTPKELLKAIEDSFIGFNAENNALPLNPVALQQADMAAPGGNFDGLVNPPGVTGGIINAQGDTGAGLGIYGNDGMPNSVSQTGSYSGTGGYMSMNFSKNTYRRLI
jgi:hypothetical protein